MDALLDTIVPPVDAQPYFRGILYGDEGSTKTISACSIGERTLLIETDPEGWVSLLNHPEIYRKTTRMRYEGLSQIEFLAEACNTTAFDSYDTFVIDTASQMVSHDLDIITGQRFKMKKIEEEVPDWPSYRLSQNKVRRAITSLVATAHKHVILTSHARNEKDKSGVIRTTLDMPRAVRGDLTRVCHLVGYLTAEVVPDPNGEGVKYRRRMQVHPTRLITAKSRIGGLPVVIDNPDLKEIVNHWLKSGLTLIEEADPVPEVEGVLGDLDLTAASPELATEISND